MSGFDDNGTVDLQDLRIRLYDHLGHRYSAVSPSPGALILLQDANMLSSPNGQYDCFGRVRGVGFDGTRFSVQEVRAQGDGESQGFDGLIVSVSHSLSIYGRTIVMPKRGVASPRHIDGMKEVDLPSGTIDERFEVYADNQVEGRSLIRPGFLRQLAEFGPMLADGHASVAFTGRQMHVVLPTGETQPELSCCIFAMCFYSRFRAVFCTSKTAVRNSINSDTLVSNIPANCSVSVCIH